METLGLLLVSVQSNTFKLSVRLSFSHLVEFELKTEDVAEGEWLTHVGLDERQEEVILVRPTLINLQDDVQNPVWIQVETSCGQKEEESTTWETNKQKKKDVIES